MKNPLQNLLIIFAVCLCVLLAVHWHREDVLRRQLQGSGAAGLSIHVLTNDVARLKAEINRLERLRQKLSTSASAQSEESTQWAELAVAVKGHLDEADAVIQSQKDSIKLLEDERAELTLRYAQLALEYNNLVELWNAQRAALTNVIRSSFQ